ncbi:hypothetical protein AHAS_Ahas20G0042900 [Arachis hypogaea]
MTSPSLIRVSTQPVRYPTYRTVIKTVKSQVESRSDLTRPCVVVKDTGVRFIQALIACAEAIQERKLDLADVLVNHASFLASQQGGTIRKVVTNFFLVSARVATPHLHPSLASNLIDCRWKVNFLKIFNSDH